MTAAPHRIATIDAAATGEWDDMWSGCEYATYFHSRDWAELWSAVTGGRCRPGARRVVFEDGLTAIVTLSVRRRFAGLERVAESSPLGTIGGWISRDVPDAAHASALAAVLLDSAPSVAWRMNPIDPSCASLSPEGGDGEVTHAIDLSPGFESVFHSWSKGHRAAVAQAGRSGVEIRRAQGPADWEAYYTIYQDSVRRWGAGVAIVHPGALFERLSEREGDRVCLWLATHEDRPVAGALCLYAPRHVVYWHGAALEAYFDRRPVNLLLHAAIRDACDRGLRWFDFNPSGGHEGVMKFKKSFGARALPSPMIRRNSPLARLVLAATLRGRTG